LISIALDAYALVDDSDGIVTHSTERGIGWERRATATYFHSDELRLATSVSIRIHGSEHDREIRDDHTKHSYRIYFRNDYGVPSARRGALFDVGEAVRRIVVRRERLFASELAFDIANRLGAETPYYKPVIFYLNGERIGIRSLTEYLAVAEWRTKLGHGDFFFYKYRGATDPESEAGVPRIGTMVQ